MSVRLCAVCGGLFLLAFAVSASAAARGTAALYVDNGNAACSDALTRAGVSAATPWCSVARAGALALPGDVVHIAPGTYTATFAPMMSGTPGAPIKYVAHGAVTLTATVKLVNVANLVVDGITVSGAPAQGIWVDTSSRITLSHLTVIGSVGYGIVLHNTHAVTVFDSNLSGNGLAGVLESSGASDDSILRNTIVGNGHDGQTYNGDGVQFAGANTVVAGNTIQGNGDPGNNHEHGVYAAATAAGYLIERNVLSGNAASDIKAAGAGIVRYNELLGGGFFGLVVSDNSAPVAVYENVIAGAFQHAVLATTGNGPSQAALWNNTIVQTGRSTNSGNAAAVMVLSTVSLDIRNNIVCYTNPDDLGVALFVNSAATISGLSSNNNWLCDMDASGRVFAWNGSRVGTAQWVTASGQDTASVISGPPAFDSAFRVTSANLGAGRGQPLGLAQDFAGTPVPATVPDFGAYQTVSAGRRL